MNTSILVKCVEELKKKEPKIDYILGMLETVIEMSGVAVPSTIAHTVSREVEKEIPTLSDEEVLLSSYAKGPIANLG